MAKRSILGLSLEGDDVGTAFQNLYTAWQYQSNSGGTFAQIYTSFRDLNILAELDGGALKLYLFYCLAAELTGESWYSVDKITDYFKKQQKRTIEGWNKELREKNLIYREKADKKSYTTYLIPYSDTLVDLEVPKRSEEEDQSLLDAFLKRISGLEPVYGRIIGVYHLFQWGKKKREVTPDITYHHLLIITQRENDVLIGHRFELTEQDGKGIKSGHLQFVRTSRFESPFRWNEQAVEGIAIDSSFKLSIRMKSSTKVWLELVRELSGAGAERIHTMPEVKYGDIKDVLQEEPEESEEDEIDESAE